MRHHFLINPAAGKGNLTDATIRRITRACTARKADYRLYTTTRPGDASVYVKNILAKETDTRHRFYACGGDGTLCEVVNGIQMTGESAEFSVVPIGTGNDFVRNFTSQEHFSDIERQLRGEAVMIDLIRCNGRNCINMANMGFDSNVAKKTGEIKRNPLVPSSLAYIFGLAFTFCSRMGIRMQIELDGGRSIDGNMLLSTVANGRFCGGGFLSNPRASLTDGLFDICAVKKISRAQFLSIVKYYKNGEHLDNEKCRGIVEYHQASRACFRFNQPVNVSIDGEIEMTDRVELEVLPRALAFSLPLGSAILDAEAEKKEAAVSRA